jgi:tyrosyl-tRNA synthetase
MNDFLDELTWRSMLHQTSGDAALRAHLAEKPRRAYVGLDPTSTSLTIGNLVTLMLLAHFQRCGHNPVVVAGGGTGLIGDPGGKTAERPLLTIEQVRHNVSEQMKIYERLLPGAPVVNNADWLEKLSFIEVLRDTGKHFSVNEMVKRDSVRNRLEGDGISYTEFSYMLLQAYDYVHLNREMDVTLQMGGSDQWGNIVSGTDLIRRVNGREAFALTTPLLLKSDGSKFGKSESGAVWLTADRTSPYAFHQFWLNSTDADVVRYLKIFTFLTQEEISAIEQSVATNPGAREAQRVLANTVTAMLHGEDESQRAEAAGRALFTGEVRELDETTISEVFDGVPQTTHSRAELHDGIALDTFLPLTSLAGSNRDARQSLKDNAIAVNGVKVAEDAKLTTADLLHNRTILIRKGKKNWAVTTWE